MGHDGDRTATGAAPTGSQSIHEAAESLGVKPHRVKSELYKLLVYEPGGFFKPHRDTEKADGMFATLVVQLPSSFTGGTFVVSHGNATQSSPLISDDFVRPEKT